MRLEKRPLAMLVAGSCLLLGVTACSNTEKAGSAKIVRINGAEPDQGFIPADANDTDGIRIMDQIYAGLVTFSPDGKIINDVAKEIKSSTDKRVWTIKLNEDRKFSDGTPVKAQNFVRAWSVSAAQADIKSTTPFNVIEGADNDGKGKLSGLKVDNDFQFTITLKRPISDFPTRLGVNCFYPLPDSAFEGDKISDKIKEKPVGNGPYNLVSWDHNREIKLVKASTYRGPRQAQNDGLTVKMYAKTDAAYNDLLAGNLDVLDKVPDIALTKYRKDLPGRNLSVPTASMHTLDIDYYIPHFANDEEGRLRREAISMAIDRQEIIDRIFYGTRTIATDYLPQNIPGHADKLAGGKVITYDPKKAKELWDKADKINPYKGTLTLTYNTNDNHQAWIDAVANNLKNVFGIPVEGFPVPDFKTMKSKMDDHSMSGPFRLAWTMGYPSAANLIEGRYMTGGSGNIVKYENPKFDDMVRKAQEAATESETAELYLKAQEILLQDLPSIPLWSANNNIGFSEKLEPKSVTTDWKGDVAFEKIVVL